MDGFVSTHSSVLLLQVHNTQCSSSLKHSPVMLHLEPHLTEADLFNLL